MTRLLLAASLVLAAVSVVVVTAGVDRGVGRDCGQLEQNLETDAPPTASHLSQRLLTIFILGRLRVGRRPAGAPAKP
jgi:hypothetical protein